MSYFIIKHKKAEQTRFRIDVDQLIFDLSVFDNYLYYWLL